MRQIALFVLIDACQYQACMPITMFNILVVNSIDVSTLPVENGVVGGVVVMGLLVECVAKRRC